MGYTKNFPKAIKVDLHKKLKNYRNYLNKITRQSKANHYKTSLKKARKAC